MSGQTEIMWGEVAGLVAEDILEAWTETSIGEICASVKSGGTPLSTVKEYYENGQIPWLKTKEIKNARIYGAENYITELGLRNSSASLIPANSISIAMYGDGGTAGRVGLTKVPLTTNQACCNLTVDERKADYEFVFYNMLGSYDDLVAMKTGSGQQNLSATLIKNFRLNLPPLPEQRAIASVLSSLDGKIDLLHRQNATLEALAETLFRQWFVEEAKEEWEIGKLPDEFICVMGSSPPGESYNELGVGLPMFQGNADFGFRFPSNRIYTTDAKRLASKYDTLVSVRAPVGAQNMANETCCIGRGVAAFRYKKDPSFYSYCYFKMRSLMVEFKEFNQTGTVFGAISKADVDALTVTIPPIYLVEMFQNKVKSIDDKVISNCDQIQTLSTLRDTLLPKLMSGEVRVAY